jgi:hypothetical protein
MRTAPGFFRGEAKAGRSLKTLRHLAPGMTALNATTPHSNTPILQYSNTPILQYSNTPILQYSNTPILHTFPPALILRTSGVMTGANGR